MKLFRSKSQSSSPSKSPSATSRLGRMLSPSSRSNSNLQNQSPPRVSPSRDAPKYRIPSPELQPEIQLFDNDNAQTNTHTRPLAPQPSRTVTAESADLTPLQQPRGRSDVLEPQQKSHPLSAPQLDGTHDEDDDRLDGDRDRDIENEAEASQVGTDISAPFDERAMTRKLMDVESSFVPEGDWSLQDSREQRTLERRQVLEQEQEQEQEQGNFSADAERFPFTHAQAQTQERQDGEAASGLRTMKSQTFFNWGPGLSLPRSPSAKIGSRVISEGFKPHGSPREDFEVDGTSARDEQNREAKMDVGLVDEEQKLRLQRQAQARVQDADEDEVDYGDSTLESPTMAVSQRYGIGAAPIRTTQDYRLQQEGTADEETMLLQSSTASLPQHEDEPSAASVLIAEEVVVRQRPASTQRAQLGDRQVSRESYMSDLSEALSDSTIGADYALQTGGATSANKETRPSGGDAMLRLPSFGSVASSLSADEPSVVKHSVVQDSIVQQGNVVVHEEQSSQLDLATPRATRKLIPDPSETVLNQHVRDVQVPATVARQYRASHQPTYIEDKEIMATPHYGHSKNSLTLKEQNSKIDKLTKENFDLKLKIHFLHQALQDRSEEGVRDLISKNAAYQAELVRTKKDNASLRKKLKALERQLANQHGRASIATTTTTSQAESEEGSGSHPLNESVDFSIWKEKALMLETENEKLVLVWQQVLNEEMERRRATELKVQQLQQELELRKPQRSPLRKLTLRRSQRRLTDDDSTSNGRPSVAHSRSSFATQDQTDVPSLSGTTVVDQLRQENITLRRDFDVQTDMLSSRNRERERLQQEIETLKLITRREESAKSSAGDSILERSVSRQQYRRPASRASMTHSQMSDAERERYESMQAHLRDENATLKMRIHDLSKEMDELESRHVSRDEADQALREADADIQYLTDAVRHLENVLQEKDHQINGLWADLRAREEENDSFKRDLMSISNSLDEVAGDRNGSQELINNLQADLDQANADLESLEKTLHNISTAKERLEVQQESAQNEIAFLREEQESDKLKIGDLQTALGNANTNLQNEIERLKQLDQLEADATQAREDGHRLRQALVAREAELAASSDKVKSLEKTKREQQQNTTSASTPKVLTALRRDLDNALAELNHANSSIREKDREIIEREDLLDEMTVEIRDLNSRLDNEIQSRAAASATSQTDKQAQERLAALEAARASEKQQYAALLQARNDLLHTTLTRLSNMCGPSWKARHAPPILSADPTLAARSLPQFETLLKSATKHIEHTITSFSAKVHGVEDEIWADFETLNTSLNSRIKRLDHLERAVQRVRVSASAAEAERERNARGGGDEVTGAGITALTTQHNGTHSQHPLARTTTSTSTSGGYNEQNNSAANVIAASEHKWALRIEEMNRRLRAEREGRLLDREGASRRLMEGQAREAELRRELERMMGRGAGVGMLDDGGKRGMLEGDKRVSVGRSEASVD